MVLDWVSWDNNRIVNEMGPNKNWQIRFAMDYDEIKKGVIEYNEELKLNDNTNVFTGIFDLILKNLEQDGYITVVGNKYSQTISGLMFSEIGGYLQRETQGKRKNQIQNLKDWLLVFGAIGATFGTIYLGYFEYVKLNHHYPFGLKIWKIDSGICILLGIILLGCISTQYLPKSKKIR